VSAVLEKKAEVGRVAIQGEGMLAVSGVLTFDTIPDVLNQSAPWIDKPGGPISIDLQEAKRADSAGLALLVEWLRRAKIKGRGLRFVNVPEQVRSLIRVNGLEEALGIVDRP
jgi:phospholipid transport system transporter-binding protein